MSIRPIRSPSSAHRFNLRFPLPFPSSILSTVFPSSTHLLLQFFIELQSSLFSLTHVTLLSLLLLSFYPSLILFFLSLFFTSLQSYFAHLPRISSIMSDPFCCSLPNWFTTDPSSVRQQKNHQDSKISFTCLNPGIHSGSYPKRAWYFSMKYHGNASKT